MMKIRSGLLIICCCGLASPVFAQLSINDSSYIRSSETMHVHFDKDTYLPGETIWFKAYLYNTIETSLAATNFYVAIYNEKGNLIQQKLYPIMAGSCYGNFEIPDSVETSQIQFKAFTKAMTINDSSNIYTAILQVYNKKYNALLPNEYLTKNIQFFPEGGQIIAEVENQVIFKATYNNGSPAIINGQIFESGRIKPIDSFFTNNSGIGKFILAPNPNRNYTAVWKDDKGNIMQTALPPVKRFGVLLHAEIIGDQIEYNVVKNKTSDSLSLLHLAAQMGNFQVYKADLSIQNEMEKTQAKFSIVTLPKGLLQITLFDKYWHPLQQRLVFINNKEAGDQPGITVNNFNSKAKGKNTIEITWPDTTTANLSVSIADINFYDPNHSHSICNDLIFSKQLDGVAENLEALSNNANLIDLALLAHPWKKYNYENAQVKKDTTVKSVDNYITFYASNSQKGISFPQDDIPNLMMTGKNGTKQFYTFLSAGNNAFKINNLVFYDTVKVNCQMQKNKELSKYLTLIKENDIKIPSSVGSIYENTKMQARFKTVDTFFITRHTKFNDVQTINEVVVKSRKVTVTPKSRLQELDEEYTSGMFKGNLKAMQFNLIDDTAAAIANVDLLQYLRYRVPGLVISNAGLLSVPEVRVINNQFVNVLTPVAIFIDENEVVFDYVEDGGKLKLDRVQSVNLRDMNTSDFAYVKYIPGIVIGSSTKSTAGAFYIYTKRGNEKSVTTKTHLPFNYITGYNSSPKFTQPDYNDKTLLGAPDQRTTLYWNPNVILDKNNNKLKFEFYNNDLSKKLLLKIEGVNALGKIIHVEKIIE